MSHHRRSVNTNKAKSWIDAKPRADTIRHDHRFTAQIWHSINTAARRRQAAGRRLNARRIAGWRLDTVRMCRRQKYKKAQRRNFTRISCWSELTFFIIYPLCVQKNRSASSYFLLLSSTHRGAQGGKKKSQSHSLRLPLLDRKCPYPLVCGASSSIAHRNVNNDWWERKGAGTSGPSVGLSDSRSEFFFFNRRALRYCLIWSQLIFEWLNWYSTDRRRTECSLSQMWSWLHNASFC